MKIKLIDFGLPENHRPLRSHANDAGADVYMPFDCTLERSVSCPLWIPVTGARFMPLSVMWEMRLKHLRKIPGSGSLSLCRW